MLILLLFMTYVFSFQRLGHDPPRNGGEIQVDQQDNVDEVNEDNEDNADNHEDYASDQQGIDDYHEYPMWMQQQVKTF